LAEGFRPSSTQVRRARASGLTSTWAHGLRRRRAPRVRAVASPWAVSGLSVPRCADRRVTTRSRLGGSDKRRGGFCSHRSRRLGPGHRRPNYLAGPWRLRRERIRS
jgi:hypothetical protein